MASPSSSGPDRRSPVRIAGRVLYWLVVAAVSVALLVALVLFFESRDESEVGDGASARPPAALAAGPRAS